MSWIKEISNEITELNTSKKALQKFGFITGCFFLLFSSVSIFKRSFSLSNSTILGMSLILLLTGLFSPDKLERVYQVWMSFAFILGGIISRVILLIMFYLVVTPLGFLSRIMGKIFLDINFSQKKDSYWIPKEKSVNYEKMY